MLQQIYPQVSHKFNYELNKDMNFSAAHFINNPKAGKCAGMHGHTYFVNVTLGGNNLDDMGFLTNFQQLKKLVHDRYDHTVMNDHEEFNTTDIFDYGVEPSTEQVAEAIFNIIEQYLADTPNRPHCLQVFVRETPTSYVLYRNPKLLAGEL